MIWVVLCLLGTYESSCSRTMVAIGDIEGWHLSELLCDGLDIIVICHYPQLMAEAVNRCYEVIFWLGCRIRHD